MLQCRCCATSHRPCQPGRQGNFSTARAAVLALEAHGRGYDAAAWHAVRFPPHHHRRVRVAATQASRNEAAHDHSELGWALPEAAGERQRRCSKANS